MTADDVLSIGFSNRDLCTRCGTCVGTCPVQALTADGDGFPDIDRERCTSCGLCGRVCPGGRVSYAGLANLTFGDATDEDTFDGRVRSVRLAHAQDSALRRGGASGGAVTAILQHLLESGQVQGCVVTRMAERAPWRGEAFIAESVDDLRQAQQSRYPVTPVNAVLQEVRRRSGRFAYVGLPCHIHGLRRLAAADADIAERIAVVIGLYCSSSLNPAAARDLLWARGIDPDQVQDLRFREGEWPGAIQAVLKDGSRRRLHRSNFKDGAINYLFAFYAPARCRTCIEGSAEFADIAASDVWRRDTQGGFTHAATTRLVTRTAAGDGAVDGAVAAGVLVAEDVTDDPTFRTQPGHTRQKMIINRIRVARLAAAGHPVPEYDRQPPPSRGRDRRCERRQSGLASLARTPRLRRLVLALLTSALGVPLIRMRQRIKRTVYG